MSSIYNVKSTLTQTALDMFCQEYHIPDAVHPELPTPNQSIHDSPVGKISVYTRLFNFANFQMPLSQFLVDVLKYFRINLSQLSIIAAAKVSHFEILCRIHGYVPTVGLFRRYSIYEIQMKTLVRETPSYPAAGSLVAGAAEFSAEACDFFATHQASFWKFSKPFLCLVGLSRYYELDDNMDLFAFIRHADPTKVWIGERQIEEGQVPLLESIEGRVIPLAGRNEQGGQDDNVEVVGPHDLNEEGDDDVQAAATDKPKETRKKKKVAGSASGSNLPPKKLREDHGASGDAGASTAGKSLVALQGLLEHSTLAVELGVTAAATVLFVTSSVTLTPEREDDGHTDSVFWPNLLTQHPAERFVISLDSSHHSSTNAADAEVTSIVNSPILPPLVITATVATTAVAGTSSAPVTGAGTGLAIQSLFADSASPSAARPDTAGPSDPCGTEISADTFYISQEIDSETL
ncbi:hypothetical protein Tco_1092359 [Tanacetum coccineum]|uniref:Transposase (putative) gypsy type domain-containing protein n=1 Tax=Tanacetum coccineum TaxID=301880 RepID=A0ABQ5I9M3_9ASTR